MSNFLTVTNNLGLTNANLPTPSGLGSNNNPSNIVFIDPRAENFTSLLAGLEKNTEAVILDSTQDGIQQITDFLKTRPGAVDSVQILSHGSAGNLQLGSTQLNSTNLEQYQQSLQQWFSPSADKRPDLLLYGCDVASGDVGTDFINKLSKITGADVAASTDLTGNAAKGGNWILEKTTGIIEAGQALTKKVRDAYQDILAIYIVTNTNDAGPGSLRQAITSANASLGIADTIVFNIAPGGPQTIKVGSTTGLPLPYINDTVTIDGTTQPGYSDTGTPIIVLDGTAVGGATANLDGLRFIQAPPTAFPVYGGSIVGGNSSNSVVQGLVISNFSGNGIKLGQADGYTGGAGPTNVTIIGNYIGTDITGTVAKPTSTWGDPNNTHAIHIYNSNSAQILNNLVSGNFTSTVTFRGPSTNSVVSGNKIGTDITGRFALANQRWGVYTIGGAVSNLTVTNNLISANGLQDDASGLPGIDIRGSGLIQNNTIGTDITGAYSLNNRGTGFSFSGPTPSAVTGNTIQGGVTASIVPFNTILALPSFKIPTLAPGSPFLSAIPQNSTSNNGTLVKDIVGSSIGNYAPVPTPGIAITATDNTNGTWQYSTDNGFSWANVNLNFPTTVPAGYNVWVNSGYPAPNNPAVAPNAIGALLLSADDKNRIRFIPNAGYTGITNSITYRGWNQRFGGNGEMINISGNFRTVASMQVITNNMSVGSNTAQINVLPVNTAPTLDPLQVISSSSFNATVATTGGILVSNILSTAVTDPDSLAQQGIAITSLDSTNGTWQYSINGLNWIPITSVSDTASLLLDSKSKLRFVRNSGYSGDPGDIGFRAWDQTSGTNGNTINTAVNGGTSSVSSGSVLFKYIIPVTPSISSGSSSSSSGSSIDPSILTLLKNPPAPATPAPVTVGEPPTDNSSASQPPAAGSGSQTSTTSTSTTGSGVTPSIAADCPCEQVVYQQPSNPITGAIQGTIGDDQLAATITNNTVYGLQGNDTIFGTVGSDNLYGDTGNDTVRGGRGRDFIEGGGGADTLYGGRGADVIKGEKGADTIYGGRGADMLSGGRGADIVYGGRGADFISGGRGNDRLFGGAGDDYLCGCGGSDVLRGGKGNDTLDGDNGNDLLIGGAGDDVLTGGAGNDRFRIQFGRGTDLITDFTVGEDFLELARGLKTSDLLITQDFVTQSSGAITPVTLIGVQPGTLFPSDKPLAVLSGVNASTLTPNNFLTV